MENTELSTQDKVLDFVNHIKNNPVFNNIRVHEGTQKGWEYYFRITGYLEDSYLAIEFSKLKSYNNHYLEISSITECKEEINEKLKQFKLL